jgi:hypothetical protein
MGELSEFRFRIDRLGEIDPRRRFARSYRSLEPEELNPIYQARFLKSLTFAGSYNPLVSDRTINVTGLNTTGTIVATVKSGKLTQVSYWQQVRTN